MRDRRIFFTLITSVTISGFIVICTLGQSLREQRAEAKAANQPRELERVECIVREYNGRIGVFRGEAEQPYRIIDFNFSLLSEYDREQLREGIIMENEEMLKKFIEDFST